MIETIRKQIYKDTGTLVIPANTTAKTPPLPFATINVTSPWIDDVGHADVHKYEDEAGLHIRRTEAFQFVFSFNVYAETDMEAIRLARLIRGWFALTGEIFMEDLNIVVVTRGNIENRTTFLVDSYEYKHGFDVQFRAVDEQFIGRTHQGDEDGNKGESSDVPVHYDWIEKAIIEFKGVE